MGGFLRSLFPRVDRRVGDYELLEEIAHGGMSVIWRARHRKTGQIAAVKVLKPESAELLEKVKRIFSAEEGQIALHLNHPNVITTYDYGWARKNCYYIAMEYVDGPNLEKLILQEDPRLQGRRMDLILQMGRGLLYIHTEGLVHRDFCPKNVLFNSQDTAKIIDFGLAIPHSEMHRAVGGRSGTASYMAPEQIRRKKLDQRTDIYAFGVSMFEVLTGRRPFPETSVRERKMEHHLNVEPVHLSEAMPSLPRELGHVVAKCIAKDPAMRYKNMAETLKDLQHAALEMTDV